MRANSLITAVLLAAISSATVSAAEQLQVASPSLDATDGTPVRVIVKLRGIRGQGGVPSSDTADVASLAVRSGVPLRQARRIESNLRVLEVGTLASPGSIGAALARLRADPDVQYAELDKRRHAHALPDDTLFPGQWYLQTPIVAPIQDATPSAVDAVSAWDLTTGSSGIVIAVLDTGVRYDHPDLMPGGSGGRLLPGFDFVSDARMANDGDGWDSDASDPGDWVTAEEAKALPFSGCQQSDSSWHGTRVSGIIGARSNNSVGVSGLTWGDWILPVRVLGKCGGFDSDITAAMLWAGGLPVDGAPANPYPARIINLSLGGGDTCPQSYQDAIDRLRARGVLVVASAGNAGSIVETPANCAGVAGIGAIRQVGTKVGFSNLGPGVALSAPGGNCVNVGAGQPCLYSIDTTTNLGLTNPTANTYTDQFRYNVGTSFSAPIVSGIAGLMLAVNGRLSTAQLIARLQEGATKPFPGSSDPAVPVCHVPTSAGDLQLAECVCTTETCGAGMANAQGAVQAALRPVAAVAPGNVSPGQDLQLRGSGSGAACGRAVSAYSWTMVNGSQGIFGADTDTATVVAPTSGTFTVRLTVTDDAGSQDTADIVVTPTSALTTAPASAGSVACLPRIAAISIMPNAATVMAGGGTQVFAASVTGVADTTVVWYVNDVQGGNAVIGTVSPAGVYAAPASRPNPSTVTVKAVPAADPSRFATASVTITSATASGGGGGGGGGGASGPFLLLLAALAAYARSAARARRVPGLQVSKAGRPAA
jgi:serine protease